MKTLRAKLRLVVGAVLLLCVGLLFLDQIRRVDAADHRDAPGISEDGRADLLDIYAFVNPNNQNVVLALTVNPFSIGGAIGVAFSSDVLYEFKIDNDGDFLEDVVIQATFTSTTPGPQRVTVMGGEIKKAGKKKSKKNSKGNGASFTIEGPANGTTLLGDQGTRAFAGLRDDPFFFDLIWTLRLLGIQPGGPVSRAPGIDFLAGLNASVLVVELPPSLLEGSTGHIIRVWATTSRAKNTLRSTRPDNPVKNTGGFVQIERNGLPAINTVLIPPSLKDSFNSGIPSKDRALFRSVAINSLLRINGDAAYSEQIADLLLPDVLTLNTTNTSGFLNGRRPADDVIDAVLNVASKGAVITDGVGANDVEFLTDFPFFAEPHDPSEQIPGRD